MLFHPGVDARIALDCAVESQQVRSSRRWTFCFRDQVVTRQAQVSLQEKLSIESYAGQMLSAVLLKICCFTSSFKGNARKSSRLFLISGTPGPGQSVPNSVLCAISSRRGKYLSSDFGGMPLISRYTLRWRRSKKNAVFIHKGRPPCAISIFSLGK